MLPPQAKTVCKQPEWVEGIKQMERMPERQVLSSPGDLLCGGLSHLPKTAPLGTKARPQ